ncbi:MAG: Xaa-Pro peptidase family protein [Acidobacteriota bacterium]
MGTNSASLEQLKESVARSGLDAFVLTPGPTLQWVTQHDFTSHERLFLLIVGADGSAQAVVPALEESNWREAVPAVDSVHPWDDADGPETAAASALAPYASASKVGVEPLGCRFMELAHLQRGLPGVEIVGAEEISSSLRLHKAAHEAEAIRGAADIAQAALEFTLQQVKVGSREREIAATLSSQLLSRGGEGISFGPIVLGGPKSALPHGIPDDRELRAGEYLLIDFGTAHKGYHCDITRTFVVGAEPDERTRAVYEAVRASNAAGCAASKPGATMHEVHTACQQNLHEPQWDEFFKHRTGHGLGLDIHEPPSVMRGNEEVVEEGMIFTVEPGLYLDGWGGVRIEDDLWIRSDGADSLTSYPRELQILGV